jgi:hypothetical protein
MKRRRIIILAVAVALAFAASGAPRHARAAVQGHDHAATATAHDHDHTQHGDSDKASHDHKAAPPSQFAEGGNHDHADSAPVSDQGCCYAWCNSVAVIHAANWLISGASHDEPFASEQPFRIAAFPSAIDPPPR